MPTDRVTVTMPRDIVEDIDRMARNRSKFILDAVRRELERRRREELRLSLQHPHEESDRIAALGIDDWATSIAAGETDELLDPREGRRVRWHPGSGWTTADED